MKNVQKIDLGLTGYDELFANDERVNLNIQLSQPILVIADLGLWNGRRMGYKEIPSGNIRDCLSGGYDYTTWYVDKKGDFRPSTRNSGQQRTASPLVKKG